MLFSTLLMDRQLRQGSLFSATSTTFFKNLLDQCLNLSLVSEFDKEIGLDHLRAMHLSDSKNDCNSKKDHHKYWTVSTTYYHRPKFKFVDFSVGCCSSQRSFGDRRLPIRTPRPTNAKHSSYSNDTRLETTKGGLE